MSNALAASRPAIGGGWAMKSCSLLWAISVCWSEVFGVALDLWAEQLVGLAVGWQDADLGAADGFDEVPVGRIGRVDRDPAEHLAGGRVGLEVLELGGRRLARLDLAPLVGATVADEHGGAVELSRCPAFVAQNPIASVGKNWLDLVGLRVPDEERGDLSHRLSVGFPSRVSVSPPRDPGVAPGMW